MKHTQECRFFTSGRPCDCGAAPSGAGVQPMISDAFDVARTALMACPDRGSSRRILEVLHERVKDALVSAAIPKAGDSIDVLALIEEAFHDGFYSPETYNDKASNTSDEAWAKVKDGFAKRLASRPQPADAQQPSDAKPQPMNETQLLAGSNGLVPYIDDPFLVNGSWKKAAMAFVMAAINIRDLQWAALASRTNPQQASNPQSLISSEARQLAWDALAKGDKP